MQTELTQPGPLLDEKGRLAQVGWSRRPLLDCNLERAHFYRWSLFQRFRMKRWDYYALFTPRHFFSATIADVGYLGSVFVYLLDFSSGELQEDSLVIPFGRGIQLERNSTTGDASFASAKASLHFLACPQERRVSIDWPGFNQGRGVRAEIVLRSAPEHESMNIIIPIGRQRFYDNTKINCLPAEGFFQVGSVHEEVRPDTCLGSLDWGRGVWEYRSFWNWASASGFLPPAEGGTIGLNLGCGFGELGKATENCVIVNGRVHKLGTVKFDYRPGDYLHPWHFTDDEGRLNLTLTPFKDRTARTNLWILFSEVHQVFGHYNGRVILDDGKTLEIQSLFGFAEEHHARW